MERSNLAPFEILERRLRVYGHANSFDLPALKENLEAPANHGFLQTFREALAASRDGDGLSREAHFRITDLEFDDDAEYRAHLGEMYAYLFEGGPLP